MSTPTRYPAELQERAIHMVFGPRGEHGSQPAAIGSIAAKPGHDARDAAHVGARLRQTRACGQA